MWMKIGNGQFVRRPFLNFPAKQDIVLKIKQICHLEYKTPEQMPFIFFISHLVLELWEKVWNVSPLVRPIKRFYLKRYTIW